MLAFYLNNQPFLLDESTSITIEEINPAWNFKEYPGDVGLGINIPFNEVNAMLLGNPERFEKFRKGNIVEFTGFRVEVDGVVKLQGTLVINDASESYKGWCRSDIGNIGKEYREKYITDSFSFAQEKTFSNKATYDPDSDDYDCPKVYNPDFFSEKGLEVELEEKIENPNHIPEDWQWDEDSILEEETIPKGEKIEDLTAAFYKSTGWIVNERDNGGLVKVPTDTIEEVLEKGVLNTDLCAISPMLFLSYFIETVFKDAGYPIGENFLRNDADMKRLLIYNNFTIVEADYITTRTKYYLNTRYTDNVYSDFVSGVVSEVSSLYFSANTAFFYKNLVPRIKLSDFLLSMQNLLNVFLMPRKHIREMDLIDRESIFTEPAINISEYLVGKWKMGEKKNVTLKFSFKHDSNDTYFQDGWENLDDSHDKIKEPVETWEDLENIEDPQLSEIRFVKSANKFAQYRVVVVEKETDGKTIKTRNIGWDTISKGFQNGFFNYGQDDEEEIKTNFSTVLGEDICIAEQKGNTSDEHFEYQTFSPRLIFSLGNGTAKYETDTLRMDWEDPEKGLLKKRFKNTARFFCQRQPVERDARLPHNAIDYISRNIWRRFLSEEGEFVIEKIRTSYGLHSIGATTINGFKVEYAPKEYDLSGPWNVGDMIEIDEGLNFDNADVWDSYPLII